MGVENRAKLKAGLKNLEDRQIRKKQVEKTFAKQSSTDTKAK